MGSRNAAYDGSYIWFNVTGTCVVIRLDPNNLECHFIKFPNTPWGITFDGDFMWFYDLKKPIVSFNGCRNMSDSEGNNYGFSY